MSNKFNVTIYKTAPGVDLVACGNYMLAAFRGGRPEIDASPRQFGNHLLGPSLGRIRSIGRKGNGRPTSASWLTLDMKPPAFLTFAGVYELPKNSRLVLFDSWFDIGRQQYADGIPEKGYSFARVAFYDLTDEFLIISPSNSARMFTLDFDFID